MFRRPALLTLLLLATSAGSPAAHLSAPSVPSTSIAAHVLNRLAFGPRPGDIARVQRIGVQAWIDEQLHPERIGDEPIEARLAGFRTLSLDTATILRDYYQPAIEERRARQRQSAPSEDPGTSSLQDLKTPGPQDLRPPGPQGLSATERQARQVLAELSDARILRAVYSERQLEEVLTDFWFNHFNVFAGKGPTRAFLTSFERDAIRPYVLGDFRQMLEAVALSPAMLFYLDNWQNVQPQADNRPTQLRPRDGRPGRLGLARPLPAPQAPRARQPRPPRGINENFARELLELHTLGVDGGYTQDDIANVARAFTGWTMRPRQEAAFVFARPLHDSGKKHVLGHTLEGGRGIEDGREVLDILAAHPSTARFIATKLAQKFVSDAPPASIVDRAARRFRETHGNLREVTRTIITSPEFMAAETYRAKVKTPLEFVASALRATGAEMRTALPVSRVLRDLGMPLYFCQPPTGYDETAEQWVSSGALVARMNFALELGGERLRGITLPLEGERLETLRDALVREALAGDVSEGTRTTLAKASTPAQVVALAIGSPEFQRQ